jgi:anti-anti-sigma factor
VVDPQQVPLVASRAARPDRPFAFVVTCSHSGDAAWIDVTGELDIAAAPRLEQTLLEARARARLVVVDLHHLTFIDCAGVHAVVDAGAQALLEGRRVIVTGASPTISAVFSLTGTAHKIEGHDMSCPGGMSGLERVDADADAATPPGPQRAEASADRLV